MSNQRIKIANDFVGPEFPPYIIAEMSGNHNGSFERAVKIIDAAKKAGAHAVKLQTFTADSMTLNVDHPRFRVGGDANPWKGEHMYDLYKRASTPWDWHKPLFEHGKKIGITIFSSPFDADAVELLKSLDCPAYKIASFELVDHDLIRCCAATGKPLIMSTGMASMEEITESVNAAREAGCKDLILLKCTSAYPAQPSWINLQTIPHLAANLNVMAGLSDHTTGVGVPIAATALGAVMIEKHVTLRRADGGVDSAFSLEPEELEELVKQTQIAHTALGKVFYGPNEVENTFKQHRRSLFFVHDISAGTVIKAEDIRSIRPGDGLAPKHKKEIVGKKAVTNILRGTPVSWSLVG